MLASPRALPPNGRRSCLVHKQSFLPPSRESWLAQVGEPGSATRKAFTDVVSSAFLFEVGCTTAVRMASGSTVQEHCSDLLLAALALLDQEYFNTSDQGTLATKHIWAGHAALPASFRHSAFFSGIAYLRSEVAAI